MTQPAPRVVFPTLVGVVRLEDWLKAWEKGVFPTLVGVVRFTDLTEQET